MQRLIITITCMNVLVMCSFWMGRSKYVIPLDSWKGFVIDNVVLLLGMTASFWIVWMIFRKA
jgi:hypothetical protein